MSAAAPLQQATANSHAETRTNPRQLRQNSAVAGRETQSNFADSRPQTALQRRLRETAGDSPQSAQLQALQRMAAARERAVQLKKMSSAASGATLQRVEDEEPLQAKFATAQRVEEDELLQGKFNTTQRVEDEEPLQNKLVTAQRVEDEEPLQGKFVPVQRVEENELLQGKFDTVQRQEQAAAKPNNTGLPNQLKSGIESLSGMSMDHVKVHYNSSQPAQLNALAYAQGSDIHVAPGQEQHLPHEAWHVVQQAQGRVKPTMQMKGGVPVNDDAGLETEADVMGAKALQLKVMENAGSVSPILQKVDAEHGIKLKQAYDEASKSGVFNRYTYHQSLDYLGYPKENDECEREPNAAFQLKRNPIQFARSPWAISGPKDYGGYNDILYQCDGDGNIDFSTPSQYFPGNPYPGLNPVVAGSVVDVSNAVHTYGTGNRYQHFKEANQIAPGYGGTYGNSPPGLTWHHLSTQYNMHLVDRLIHSKHGHNGGVHIW